MRTASTNGMRRLGDSRDISVAKYEAEREGVMKFKPIYKAVHSFLTESGYVHPQTGGDKIEDLYWERWRPNGTRENHIWWRLKKDINPYIRYFIQLDWQILLAKPSEVAHKGKKVSAEFMGCTARVECILQVDINDRFRDSLAGKLKKMFFHKVYQSEIGQHKTELYEFSQELQRLIKHMFEMQSDKAAPVNFEPVMGYKS